MQIGATLREKRRGAGITLQEVARETGLSKSFISQVEVGAANPSIASLKQIADVLGLPLAAIFATATNGTEVDAPHAGVSVVRSERRKLLMPPLPTGAMFLLSPDSWGKMEVIMAEFQPGYDTGEEMYTHQGEECGLVLAGTLEVTVEGAIYVLGAGDSIYFSSQIPHRFRNCGVDLVRTLWVNTPASY